MENYLKYRGQWGGKIENGEEMWWSEPHHRLFFLNRFRNILGRLRFICDVRHYFLINQAKRILKWPSVEKHKPVILDFGCGTGGVTISFSKYLGLPIQGYDLFQTQIQIANEQAKKWQNDSTFHLLKQDGSLPLADASVDMIVSGDVLGHVPSIPVTLKDWARVLKPGAGISLFTEANYSESDRSVMARLARQGMDMCAAVPEHISIFPKETLEKMFLDAGFEILERRSANVFHWFFFPKDYVLLFKSHAHKGPLYYASLLWSKILKLTPFYPVPIETARLLLTLCFGKRADGTAYFYLLRKK